jgi:hypothetical protein
MLGLAIDTRRLSENHLHRNQFAISKGLRYIDDDSGGDGTPAFYAGCGGRFRIKGIGENGISICSTLNYNFNRIPATGD